MFGVLGTVLGLIAASQSGNVLESTSSEPLASSWSYHFRLQGPDGSSWQQFSGLADSEGNLYWLFCSLYGRVFTFYGCSLHSSDQDGNSRFDVTLGSGPGPLTNINLYLVAGSIVVTEVSAVLYGRSTSNGELLWTHDFRDEYLTIFRELGGVAHDGEGRVVVLAGAAAFALSVSTGETLWRRDLRRNAQSVGFGGPPIFDESGNVYCSKSSCMGRGPCKFFITSLDPHGTVRFETETRAWNRPVAVAQGRLVITDWHSAEGHPVELLDAEMGSRIVTLPGDSGGTPILISGELGFYIEGARHFNFFSPVQDVALTAFDLASGAIQWRFPLTGLGGGPLLTEEGNILVSQKLTVLEISPQGQLLRATRLRPNEPAPSEPRCDVAFGTLIFGGRWFSQCQDTVLAYDLPGAPGGGLGWNSLHGNAQHSNRPRVK